jgi:hypothetical protein
MIESVVFITSLIFIGIMSISDLGIMKYLYNGKLISHTVLRILRIILIVACAISFIQIIVKYMMSSTEIEGYTPSTATPAPTTPAPTTPAPTTPAPTKAPGSDGIIAGGYTTSLNDPNKASFGTDYLEQADKPNASKQEFNVDNSLLTGSPIWKESGSFKYSGTGYVPDYEESTHLNKQFQSKPAHLTNTPYLNGGFCSALKSTPLQLEDKCNSLSQDVCASTECCVLLGGQKCVKGNESGPFFKDNYSNFLIQNKDYYYYQGKCFGNCPS